MCKWDCDTGRIVGKSWKGKGGGIHALALSPDGKIIACGRENGSVQRWTTDGKMNEGVWTSHGNAIWSLSWSPSGSQLASGFHDGTILIQNGKNGKVMVGPIQAEEGSVWSLAHSSSGKRIASGGDSTISIWNTKTGKLVVGPIKGLGHAVASLVWSSDDAKLYSASDKFARVFDSKSGELLHFFEHDYSLWSVALSPKNNVLACVGLEGVAQLWNTQSHQPLGQPLTFHYWNHVDLRYVSFSRDGRHLAYGGSDNKLTIWMVRDIFPRPPARPPSLQQSDGQSAQQESRPNFPSSSYLDADSTRRGSFTEEVYNDPYNNFQSSQQYLPSPSPGFHLPSLFSARRFLDIIPRGRPPPDESVPQERAKHGLFSRRTRSNTSLELATIKPIAPAHTPLRQSDKKSALQKTDGQSTQQATRPNSPSSSYLDADATGGDGFIEEAHDNSYNNFFQSSQQSLPSPSPGFHFPSLSYFLNVISRRRLPPDESVPHERSKHGFFSRHARSNPSLELAAIKPNQPVLERKVEEGKGDGENVDDRVSTHDSLSVTRDKGKQQGDSAVDVQSPPSYGRTLPAHLDSKDSRGLWERLMQGRGAFSSLHSSTPPANASGPILRNPWHWNSSSFPVGSSRHPVNVAACRDEDRYGIAPESDAEAAAAMLRTNVDVTDTSTRPGQFAVGVQLSQGRPTQAQASTSGSEEIAYEGVSCCGFFFGYRRHSNSRQQ
ncbi:WD40 repeat-like protein [Suillus decipiens]|nr:WD40 repeat-like protein [Suillus decipiens]